MSQTRRKTSFEIEGLADEDFRIVAEDAPVMLWLTNTEGEIIFTNSRWAKFVGASSDMQLSGNAWLEALHPDDLDGCVETFHEAFVTHQSFEMEYRLRRMDGSYRYVLDTGEPFINREGKFSGFIGSSTDITDRKTREMQLRQSQLELSMHSREMQLINAMNSYLQVCKTLDETYSIIVNYAEKLFEHCSGVFYLFNENHTSLKSVVSWGDDGSPPPIITSKDCWALRQSKPHIVEKNNKSILCHHIKACPENGYICAPAIAQGEMIGLLHVGFPEPPEEETFESQWLSIESRMRVVSITADNLAMALVSLKLREELRNQSVKDPLTKLFNRRYMEEALELEISRSERSSSELGVIIMDLDHFKNYNDKYGHSAGDQVLLTIAETIQENLRKEDIACRYGGEEIVLILPGIPREVLVKRVDRLREVIGNTELDCRGVSLPNVTVSIGVSSYPINGGSGEELLRLADKALYTAKEMGRNRVIAAEAYAEDIDEEEEDRL